MTLLLLILGLAVFNDLRTRRIPNVLIAFGLPAGLVQVYLTAGMDGLLGGTAGMLIGMGVLLPFFALGLIGAGDVKLLGVVGAFVGHAHIFPIILYTMMAGGVVGILSVLLTGNTGRFVRNLKVFFISSLLHVQRDVMPLGSFASQSAVRIPYAVAIAAGVLVWMGLQP